MKSYADIDKEKLKELLNANWMTHDAQWLMLCAEKLGMVATNEINRKAVRNMASVEVKRLKKAMGVKEIKNFAELKNFLECAFEIIRGSFMRFQMEFPEENIMLWKIPRCFAHDGVKSLGLITQYECGIVERLYAWFDTLGVRYTISPKPKGCNMVDFGKCEMQIRFDFKPGFVAEAHSNA
ncbi:MAG: hypothetical protein LDLANPLL_01325 [Turneriella sp.]|nr:hypothetical protein [Turneriella sp.]